MTGDHRWAWLRLGFLFVAPWPAFVVVGAVLGALSGVFGVGGSSLATPLLSLLGLPGLIAVASPLPATLPTALTAAWPYLREHHIRPRAALWSLLGAARATVAGALLSRLAGGGPLLIASGVVLAAVGVRVLHPVSEKTQRVGEAGARTVSCWWPCPRGSAFSRACWPTVAVSFSSRCFSCCSV